MKKSTILTQLKINRTSSLIAEGVELDYFRRIIEAIRSRNYPRLAAMSAEYGISLVPLYRVLEKKATEFFQQDMMPRSCEIALLRLMLSLHAEERRLLSLAPVREMQEEEVTDLYFRLFSLNAESEDISDLNEALEDFGLRKLRDYILDSGLQRWFNMRYRTIKPAPDENLAVHQVINEIGLPVVFDEHAVVRRYAAQNMALDTSVRDMKDNLYLENTLRNEAGVKLRRLYDLFDNYPCDFLRMKELMFDLNLQNEFYTIEREGINNLRDYIRSNSPVGAQEVALRYDFVAPANMSGDLSLVRKTVAGSFLSQALKSKKGKVFLRAEALYDIQTKLNSGQCFQLPDGNVIAILHTSDQADHYIFGRYPARQDQANFALVTISSFLCQESGTKAARNVIWSYMEALAGEIHSMNALKKSLYSLPLVAGLAFMLALVYYFTLGGLTGSVALGSLITLVGLGISAKNGYDEEITPGSHERIPEYFCRQQGKIIPTPVNSESFYQPASDSD